MDTTRILLVEDQIDSSQVLLAGLNNLNPDFEVVQADTGEEALRALASGTFDLLITDIILPGISGLELLAQFRHYSPNSKSILISGVVDLETRKEIARAGAEAFFFKPIDLADLLDAVERVLLMEPDSAPFDLDINESDLKSAQGSGRAISEEIMSLRESVNALSVLLISERGQVMARAGTLPDEAIETSLMPDLMASFFSSLRVASFIKSEQPDNLHCFRGKDFHLHLIALSPSYALLISTKPQNSDRLSRLSDKSQIAVAKLSDYLADFELPYEPSMELFKDIKSSSEDNNEAELDPELEGLLHNAETKPMNHRKAEKYWKSVSQEILVHPARGGALTYEQARRLGLTPADEK